MLYLPTYRLTYEACIFLVGIIRLALYIVLLIETVLIIRSLFQISRTDFSQPAAAQTTEQHRVTARNSARQAQPPKRSRLLAQNRFTTRNSARQAQPPLCSRLLAQLIQVIFSPILLNSRLFFAHQLAQFISGVYTNNVTSCTLLGNKNFHTAVYLGF